MRFPLPLSLLTTAAIGGVLSLPALAHAQVDVTSDVTYSAGLYTYRYSVTNNSSSNLSMIYLGFVPRDLVSLTAPTGYTFLSSVGAPPDEVSLVPINNGPMSNSFAPGTTVSGFSLQSPSAPQIQTYKAFNANGFVASGSDLLPTVVPEPGALALGLTALASGAGVGLLRSRRRARHRF